jgi:hypothetical protein
VTPIREPIFEKLKVKQLPKLGSLRYYHHMGYTTLIAANLQKTIKVHRSTFFREKSKIFAYKLKITQKSIFLDLLTFDLLY